MLFLINAIYFKGQWQFEFKKEDTKPEVFRLAGEKQTEIPMMSQSRTFFYFQRQRLSISRATIWCG